MTTYLKYDDQLKSLYYSIKTLLNTFTNMANDLEKYASELT